MPIYEQFTNVKSSDISIDDKNELYKIMITILLMKLLFIYLVTYFVWPKVMPQLFPSVNPRPTFVQLLGFSIMIGLLL